MRIIRDQQKVALTFRDQSFSYHDLLMNAAGYGNMFADASARRVMIFAENRPEWIFAFFGCWLQGAVAIPVDVMSTASELSYMIDDSKPDIIICTPATKKVTEKALQHVQHRPAMMLPDIATQPASESPESIAVEDTGRTAVIIYTSGTTGSPKGVMLTFENLLANIRAVSESIPIFTARETTLILLPLHHIFPLVGSLIAPLYSGGSTAMSASLDTADILGTLQRHRVSIIIGVPRLYALIRKGVMDKINASLAGRLIDSAGCDRLDCGSRPGMVVGWSDMA